MKEGSEFWDLLASLFGLKPKLFSWALLCNISWEIAFVLYDVNISGEDKILWISAEAPYVHPSWKIFWNLCVNTSLLSKCNAICVFILNWSVLFVILLSLLKLLTVFCFNFIKVQTHYLLIMWQLLFVWGFFEFLRSVL